ncbi:MAG: ABC transporter permease [Candidatus Freyarchaeota archaeon]
MSKRVRTQQIPEKPLTEEEPLGERVLKILSQSARLFWEEVKNSYRTKSFLAFAALMVLPMLIILISYAVTQYPTMFNRVQISLFLNGVFLEDGAILTFRDVFAETMGVGFQMTGFATLYYTGVPIIAVVTILTSGIIAGERDKGTLPVYFAKPIYKTQLVLTKYLAFAFISLILTAFVFYTMYLVFILAVGSVTTLCSSLVDRPILAGVVSLVYLLVISFFSRILIVFLGSVAESLKYLDLSGLANSILNVNIMGIDYYRAVWNIITRAGFLSNLILGQLIDPTLAATILTTIILATLTAACIITQIREVK